MSVSIEDYSARVVTLCKLIYRETSAEYERMKPTMGSSALGFKILYGPPLTNAPILFMGYQPGGHASDASTGEAIGELRGWPSRCEYAYEQWRLARQMRKIWRSEFLSLCVAMNAIFFRAPSAKDWKKYVSHREAEQFSFNRAKAIVEALQPMTIVVIGFETFDQLASGSVILSSGKGRALLKNGNMWGRPAYGIIHLSAQVSNSDIDQIRIFFERQGLS